MSKQPLWHVSRRMQRQLDGWKLLLWLLFVAWWWYPLLFVLWFFYVVIKYSIPVFEALFDLIKKEVTYGRNGSGTR